MEARAAALLENGGDDSEMLRAARVLGGQEGSPKAATAKKQKKKKKKKEEEEGQFFEHETIVTRSLDYAVDGRGRRAAAATVTTIGSTAVPSRRHTQKREEHELLRSAVVVKTTLKDDEEGAADDFDELARTVLAKCVGASAEDDSQRLFKILAPAESAFFRQQVAVPTHVWRCAERYAEMQAAMGQREVASRWRGNMWRGAVATLRAKPSQQAGHRLLEAAGKVEDVWRQTHEAMVLALGESNAATLVAATELARSLMVADKEAACALLHSVYGRRSKTLGPKHPLTRSTKLLLHEASKKQHAPSPEIAAALALAESYLPPPSLSPCLKKKKKKKVVVVEEEEDDEEAWLLARAAMKLPGGGDTAHFSSRQDDPESSSSSEEEAPPTRRRRRKPDASASTRPAYVRKTAENSLDVARDLIRRMELVAPPCADKRKQKWNSRTLDSKPPPLFCSEHSSDLLPAKGALRYDRALHPPCILETRDSRRGFVVSGGY